MMNQKIKMIANGLLAIMVALVLVTCSSHPHMIGTNGTNQETQSFRSNGERIYFTSTSDRGTSITSTGGLSGGMMGNRSSGGMMNAT